MTKSEVAQVMEETFQAMRDLREAGQAEYSHSEENAFRNFESISERTGVSREKVLEVFMLKHIDGIAAHINGHTSQREDVTGRIHDALVYLILLKGMLLENEQKSGKKVDFEDLIDHAYIPRSHTITIKDVPGHTKIGALAGE